MLQDWHNGTATVFTDRVVRILDGALRAAAERKPPVKKAGEVPFQWLEDTVKRHFWKDNREDDKLDPYTCRTVFRVVFEYLTFCRFSDFQKLQAKHIEQSGVDLLVTFPAAKNDQMHNGQLTILKANGTEIFSVGLGSAQEDGWRQQEHQPVHPKHDLITLTVWFITIIDISYSILDCNFKTKYIYYSYYSYNTVQHLGKTTKIATVHGLLQTQVLLVCLLSLYKTLMFRIILSYLSVF